MYLQASDIFNSAPTQNLVREALALVDRVIVPLTRSDASRDELLVATGMIRNTTAFLLKFQRVADGKERIMVNEVRLFAFTLQHLPHSIFQTIGILRGLNNVLANPDLGAVEIGVDVIVSSEDYGSYLLENEGNFAEYLDFIGK